MTDRTGPVGRAVRAGWLLVVAITLLSIVDARGPARFRDPHVLGEASAWLLHVVMLAAYLALAGAVSGAFTPHPNTRRAQIGALLILGAGLAVGAAIGRMTSGAVWAYPLPDSVWTFDLVMLVQELGAFALAIVLGTPGCEVGVWPELVARAGGRPRGQTGGLACVVGLQFVDRWEARRAAAAARG